MFVNQNNIQQQIQRCRICLRRDQLIMSCNCKKDFAFVHKYCLSRWLELTGHQFCDLCQFRFIMKREQKSYKSWLFEHSEQMETLLEICVRTMNIAHIYILGLIALSLFDVRLLFKLVIGIFMILRTVNIVRLWGLLIARHITEYKDLKKNHLNVRLKQISIDILSKSKTSDFLINRWLLLKSTYVMFCMNSIQTEIINQINLFVTQMCRINIILNK